MIHPSPIGPGGTKLGAHPPPETDAHGAAGAAHP